MSEELLDGHLQLEDQDNQLRPMKLADFIGQGAMKSNLSVFMKAAKNRSEALDHTLLYGPPGLGKTTIAHIVSKEMGVNIKATSGPILSKAADLAAILTNLQEGDVLFIDEIHRLNINIEEVLYSAMEDFSLDIIVGEGPAARSIRISLPKFTLVGATTRLGLISNPLRDRFGIPLRLDFYSPEELCQVIKRGSSILNIDISEEGANEIAARARGTPRIALRLLRRVRDFAETDNYNNIGLDIARTSLDKLGVDHIGLDSNDYRYLSFIKEHYNGGPVGVETISAALAEERDGVEDTIEPYLIQIGFVQRTPRGRILTQSALKHLG
ncbi:MAG UNVERIFIED_CONTAM: Holliday junction branch migration DNA helicase RuvB [Rickettsiaceae bacterium]|jgi:Holliday junction DNA helicase RuvB